MCGYRKTHWLLICHSLGFSLVLMLLSLCECLPLLFAPLFLFLFSSLIFYLVTTFITGCIFLVITTAKEYLSLRNSCPLHWITSSCLRSTLFSFACVAKTYKATFWAGILQPLLSLVLILNAITLVFPLLYCAYCCRWDA